MPLSISVRILRLWWFLSLTSVCSAGTTVSLNIQWVKFGWQQATSGSPRTSCRAIGVS